MVEIMNSYRYIRQYTGAVKAIILDWSGTTLDRYVMAPAVAFVDVFKKHGVSVSMTEARVPMGLRKDAHIKALTENVDVRQRWKEVHGRFPDQSDVDKMYHDFVPLQLSVLSKYSQLLPGTAETMQKLRKDFNIKIGSTTGYVRSMVDVVLADVAKQGFTPDVTVAGDEVINGCRPKPFMIYRNMDLLDIHPIESVIKVDDTASGVVEALEAGCWGIGVSKYSNYMNIDSLEQEAELTEEALEQRLEHSRTILRNSGAHYVIDSVADLPKVVDDINRRLSLGEKP
ncbi:phosphonoacetaldehyde hydrolase isoform X1 [Octopus sinensis]|uniref:Phosphonoacetaldehyde hydrolase isoform X1 n=2 Tax=Octopus sinensis TaxID=2607531 RepID=A0A7E6F0W3_9MOLL|nr:phosphonoacetaldehyde hydrolase isoform X1 [Octopus sinensis]